MGDQEPIPAADVKIHDLVEDDEVWRRIPPQRFTFDSNRGIFRPSTDCFRDHPNGTPMSAFLASECKDPVLALAGNDGFALVAINVRIVRECNQTVVPAQKDDLAPGHVHVAGNKSDSVRKRFARECRWVVEPSDDAKEKVLNRARGQD